MSGEGVSAVIIRGNASGWNAKASNITRLHDLQDIWQEHLQALLRLPVPESSSQLQAGPAKTHFYLRVADAAQMKKTPTREFHLEQDSR